MPASQKHRVMIYIHVHVHVCKWKYNYGKVWTTCDVHVSHEIVYCQSSVELKHIACTYTYMHAYTCFEFVSRHIGYFRNVKDYKLPLRIHSQTTTCTCSYKYMYVLPVLVTQHNTTIHICTCTYTQEYIYIQTCNPMLLLSQ